MFKHPKDVDMTYLQHMLFALTLSLNFLLLSFKSFVHAIVPSLFLSDASDFIKERYKDFEERIRCKYCDCKCDECSCDCKCKKCNPGSCIGACRNGGCKC